MRYNGRGDKSWEVQTRLGMGMRVGMKAEDELRDEEMWLSVAEEDEA